jgi:hypothetical protein
MFILAIFSLLSVSLFAEVYTLWGYEGNEYTRYLGKFTMAAIEKFVPPSEIPEPDRDSVFNEYGIYGSKYQNTIWNESQQYGNKYADFSISNPSASHPPVIVDSGKNIVGYLTSNKNLNENTDFGKAVSWAFRLQ